MRRRDLRAAVTIAAAGVLVLPGCGDETVSGAGEPFLGSGCSLSATLGVPHVLVLLMQFLMPSSCTDEVEWSRGWLDDGLSVPRRDPAGLPAPPP